MLGEGRIIQKQIHATSKITSSDDDRLAERFAECMSTEKAGRVIRFLDAQCHLRTFRHQRRIDNVPVLDILKSKHPDPMEINLYNLRDIPINIYSDNLILFERLDGPMIGTDCLSNHRY